MRYSRLLKICYVLKLRFYGELTRILQLYFLYVRKSSYFFLIFESIYSWRRADPVYM